MNVKRTFVSLLALLALGQPVRAASEPLDKEAPQALGLADDRGTFLPDKPARPAPSKRLGLTLAAVSQVALPEIDREALLKADEERARTSETKVLRFGLGRAVRLTAADGDWYDLASGGRLWVADVVAPGALGLRLHFAKASLPAGAEAAVYEPEERDRKARYLEDGQDLPAREAELFDSAAALAANGGWTRTIFGERARVEVFLPKGAGRRGLPVSIDRLQHIYLDPVAKVAPGLAKGIAGSCHNDVSCYPAWADVAKAVAGIGVIDGDSLFCTGQLLNAQNNDKTPYWLTANHCLSTSSEANSAEIYWLFQTPSCGAAAPSLSSVPSSKGATLLSTNASSDYTLLMIEGTLPSGLFWAGWTSSNVADGTDSTAVHHPSGDFKRISFGDKASNPTCGGANHVRVNWTDGPTEPGSSGSGIFRNDTQQLYGQLHCGPSACGNETNDSYGAFSATYPNISNYLAGGNDDGAEDNDTCATAELMSPGFSWIRIVKSTDTDWYKASVAPGKTLTVTLTFTHANGDVDTKLYSTCGGSLIDSSTGTGNTETLTFTNNGFFTLTPMWHVYLYNDTRAIHTMNITVN
jgi:lysyl endopeptidase